jgi:hypothetical protein
MENSKQKRHLPSRDVKTNSFEITPILQHIAQLAADNDFYGSLTLRFQGPQGLIYIITERGQRPGELVEVVNVRS